MAERELSKEEITELKERAEKKDEDRTEIIYELKENQEVDNIKGLKSLELKLRLMLAKIKKLKKKKRQDEEGIGVVYDLKRGVKRYYVITTVHKLLMDSAAIFHARQKRWDIEEYFKMSKNSEEKALIADSKDPQGLLNVITLFMLGVTLFYFYCRFRRMDREKMVIFETMLLFFNEVTLRRRVRKDRAPG